jgi:hypothetical protein
VSRRRGLDDEDSLPVMVPRNDKVLVPISASRVRRLTRAPDQGITRTTKGEALGAENGGPPPMSLPVCKMTTESGNGGNPTHWRTANDVLKM